MLVTANRPQDYAFLKLPVHADLRPGRGPLGGLYTALVAAKHPTVAVVACDMPFASASLLAVSESLLLEEAADVVIAETAQGFEPLHAVYRRERCIPAIEAAMEADRWRMISWFADVKVRTLAKAELERYDPDGVAFWNVNTPEEFAEAERRATAR
jgi:molybdopterin-guanine dinucleotide biosynthesis protein A